MARDDEDTPWVRQLLVTLGALLAVAVVIGAVVGVVAVGAAKVAGLDDPTSSATAEPSLYIPSGKPTTKLDTYPDPSTGTSSAAPSAGASSSPTKKPTKKSKPKGISLQALPKTVSANQRITLTGVFKGHEGVRLQVQRFEGGAWTDFPVQVTVTGGVFHTYITTGRSGVNRLRMAAPGGATSNPVRVTVR